MKLVGAVALLPTLRPATVSLNVSKPTSARLPAEPRNVNVLPVPGAMSSCSEDTGLLPMSNTSPELAPMVVNSVSLPPVAVMVLAVPEPDRVNCVGGNDAEAAQRAAGCAGAERDAADTKIDDGAAVQLDRAERDVLVCADGKLTGTADLQRLIGRCDGDRGIQRRDIVEFQSGGRPRARSRRQARHRMFPSDPESRPTR